MKVFGPKFRSVPLGVIFLALGLQAQRGEPQAEEPWLLIGVWKLNIAQSKFNSGPPPRSNILKWEWDGDRLKHTAERVTEKGEKISGGWNATYDGTAYQGQPLSGSGNETYDHISLKRVDAYTSDVTLTRTGKEVMNFRRVVSKDGKTLTLTRKAIPANGQPVVNVEVYDRQ